MGVVTTSGSASLTNTLIAFSNLLRLTLDGSPWADWAVEDCLEEVDLSGLVNPGGA